jgi:hypothetical protein
MLVPWVHPNLRRNLRMFIKYTKPNNHALSNLKGDVIAVLRPGWNEFPSEIFEINKNDPEIKGMIADGHIEFLDAKVTSMEGRKKVTKVIGADDSEVHVKDLDEKKAIEVIKSTYNRDLLQRWIDEENRSKVKLAIDAQLKPLLPENQTSTSAKGA